MPGIPATRKRRVLDILPVLKDRESLPSKQANRRMLELREIPAAMKVARGADNQPDNTKLEGERYDREKAL